MSKNKFKKYNHLQVEKQWQNFWQKNKIFLSRENPKKKKKYVLIEFPYPSGAGLHMGHLRPYVAGDVVSRYFRMKGFNVLYPIGWDAFGLPAENYAIKNKVHPSISTEKNVRNAKAQMLSWGLSFDWSREINTTHPDYYKWTQWIFLQLYKKGLAYEATGLINWCPKDKTGLANEEVIDGKCERCGELIEKKELRQWYLKITQYAEKLLQGLNNLPEWPEQVKLQQENWIGKSEGAEINFTIRDTDKFIKIFTTRPDTLFGATYMVISPEHPLIFELESKIQNFAEVKKYIEAAKYKTEIERSAQDKEKTGVELKGVWAVNPATNQSLPVWVADYVLMGYGTGAIMAVPAHDERDKQFAEKYSLPIIEVVDNQGKLINSAVYTGMVAEQAKQKITQDFGKSKIQYKLRDWLFSRQRYWGEPIPIIHCSGCGKVPVSEKELPVRLPSVKKYEPTGTGESPLAVIEKWVKTKCPKCKKPAKRETNTMPQWAGSSWYWLRYTDSKNKKSFADKQKLKYWTPVDVYFGGYEHTTLHLLYSRFWNLFLFDQKMVSAKEPYTKRVPHGIVLGPDGEKMSKSRGNVVDPQKIVKTYGADTLRLYMLFLGPHGDQVAWNDNGIMGIKRFLDKLWFFAHNATFSKDSPKILRLKNQLIKKISEDITNFRFNTAISAFMSFLNETKEETCSLKTMQDYLKLLHPFAPHLSEEIYKLTGGMGSLSLQVWPKVETKYLIDSSVQIVVQVNGKLREKITLTTGLAQAEVEKVVLGLEKIKQTINKNEIKKIIYISNKLINIVI